MSETGSYSEGSRGGVAFLQRRVSAFGLIATGIFFFGLLCRTIVILALGDDGALWHPSFLFHLTAAVVFLLVWVLCRGRARTRAFVRSVEVGGTILGSVALTTMAIYVPLVYHPELIVTLALTQGLVARAVFVPSSPRLTLAVGATIGVPLLLGIYGAYAGVSVAFWTRLGLPWAEFGSHGIVLGMVFTTALWWAVTVAVCTAASKVIFGLRKKVQQAKQLGQYVLEEKLGEGAMGMVFRARHAMLARPTAVKLLLPDKIGEEHIARFEREVQQTARLTHPHTVTIFDYGRTPDGVFYYAMELLEGASLDKVVDVAGQQPPERVAYIMDQVAAALGEAHGIGLIHRDIKPANIILTQQGGEPDVAKVVDFGLVKDLGSDADPALSTVDAIAGTPLYMSPETVIAYHQVDGRSDLYSLGAVCYYLLTGEPVFKAGTAAEVCTAHVHTEPVPPSKRCDTPVPADLESLILACLAKDPADRPQTANHVRARLWAAGTHKKWNTDRARRWWRKYGDALDELKGVDATPLQVARTISVDVERVRI